MPNCLVIAVTLLLSTAAIAAADKPLMDHPSLPLPAVGDHALRILSPRVLEVSLVSTKDPEPAPVTAWNFVTPDGKARTPPPGDFEVTVEGKRAEVAFVGFRRRVLYAAIERRDLRIGNSLYLVLAQPLPSGPPPQTVTVRAANGALQPVAEPLSATNDPLRFSPVIHINQAGYAPALPKVALIGSYLGNLGELVIPHEAGFRLVEAKTGATVFEGPLTRSRDVGYTYSPRPYQEVFAADFTRFTRPGEYRLAVPGLGVSAPFVIDDGVAMNFLRTYALGLYHQRCGTANVLPFTRFTHDACHMAPAEIPTADPAYAFTWTTIAQKNADYASNPRHTAPQLKDAASQLYPFVRTGTVDVSGGHHDAGDYSKYTINVANLVHLLMFTVDAIPGAAGFDNLGLPESGDGIGDLLQEAKWEADYVTKLQDTDGGFYFLVHPKTREYESNVLPDHGDTQVVWPKNTAATAACVAALAQCASSPEFRRHYPEAAALYLRKARLGWEFLTKAIAKYGKDGAYQKITFYGDNYMHDDELAWAACEMYLATGEPAFHAQLHEWFPDPSDPATMRWGWWRLSESWGNAIRSYAFAARTGRLKPSQLDAAYLKKCEEQVIAAGDDVQRWSAQNAYASSFPEPTKRFQAAGWFYSLDQASDMAAAYQLAPKPEYIEALVGNMNYEGGANPVNVPYLTGIGTLRQREIVNQYARNDRRALPPDGIPVGNMQGGFDYLPGYGLELKELTYPSDDAELAPYPFYDRWSDAWNVRTESITLNQARSLLSLSVLAAQTPARAQSWTAVRGKIEVPDKTVPLGAPVTLRLTTPGMDQSVARIVWEARDQEPAFGPTYTLVPKNNGSQWVEAEAQWLDGRRVFAVAEFTANSPVVNWVNGALPEGAQTAADGGDSWTWVSHDPSPHSAPRLHQSNLAAGVHEHWFENAAATLQVNAGDTLFAYVYLDPEHPPREVMLMWNDGTWEHRAYWGANEVSWGNDGTPTRRRMGRLPPTGKWVRLEVPASAVDLDGHNVSGMGFTLFDGRATWDAAGVMSAGP